MSKKTKLSKIRIGKISLSLKDGDVIGVGKRRKVRIFNTDKKS